MNLSPSGVSEIPPPHLFGLSKLFDGCFKLFFKHVSERTNDVFFFLPPKSFCLISTELVFGY